MYDNVYLSDPNFCLPRGCVVGLEINYDVLQHMRS